MRAPYTLVVTDDEIERDSILEALHEQAPGRRIEVVAEAGDALQALHRRGRTLPELIVIDADAPRVRSLQLPVLIRTHPRTRGVAMVTLVGGVHDLWRARTGRLVSDWFVHKPAGVLALAAACDAAIAHRRGVVSSTAAA